MTLDLTEIAPQIAEMIAKIKSSNQEQQEHLKCAQDKLSDTGINIEKLKRKIINAKTPSWSPAGLVEGLSQHYSAPPIPAEYTVLATDGSNIDVDRHRAAHCYLINIGAVSLHYGIAPAADLESVPHLYVEDKDLVITNKYNVHQEQQIRGGLLDAKRAVEECRKLAVMASRVPSNSMTLAMMDGSLVLFGMQNYPDYVVEELVDKGLIQAMDEVKKLSDTRSLALASYISLPQSDDVVSVLRIAICPQETVNCESSCAAGNSACDVISGINDRMLFGNLLKVGERSALFVNPSEIVKKRYGIHQVFFFYLRVEDEIARVEIPEWVARRPNLIDLTHALTLDQCRRGQGYPVALSEAHEQAVVTGLDREEFWGLVEESLVEQKLPNYTSIKSRSKRTRWI
jgi:hypothetical protein